jgi:hypothetical protein
VYGISLITFSIYIDVADRAFPDVDAVFAAIACSGVRSDDGSATDLAKYLLFDLEEFAE